MKLRSRVGPAVALAALAATVGAQPIPQDGRARLRDRYDQPRRQQNLDEAIRKFGDEDPQTRLEGIEAFGQAGDDAKAREYLIQGASDPDTSVRIKSIDVLGDARVKEATLLLVQQLFMRDVDLATKQRVLAALGKIGDPRATKPILDFLARDVDPIVRGNAIFALGDIGDRRALSPLAQIGEQTDDENLRALARAAVRKIEEKPAPAVVPPALAGDKRLVGPPDEATP